MSIKFPGLNHANIITFIHTMIILLRWVLAAQLNDIDIMVKPVRKFSHHAKHVVIQIYMKLKMFDLVILPVLMRVWELLMGLLASGLVSWRIAVSGAHCGNTVRWARRRLQDRLPPPPPPAPPWAPPAAAPRRLPQDRPPERPMRLRTSSSALSSLHSLLSYILRNSHSLLL